MSSELIRYDGNGVARLFQEAEENLVAWTQSIKTLEAAINDLKTAIMKDMEANGVIKIDTDNLTINYIAETEKETFQTKRFKEERKDLYDSYCKLTRVAPQVRIKVKQNEDMDD